MESKQIISGCHRANPIKSLQFLPKVANEVDKAFVDKCHQFVPNFHTSKWVKADWGILMVITKFMNYDFAESSLAQVIFRPGGSH
jgi:hypothetical protein